MRWVLSLFAVCGLCVTVGLCSAETVQAHHARVELLSREKAIAPSQPFLLGVHFFLEKGWHIYWTNPGDSGQPPVLEWQLPSGFSVETIEWPTPKKLTRASLADYGYQDDVTLLVRVHVSSGLKTGSQVEIALKAKWLICSDVCIPDHAMLHLNLPASTSPATDGSSAAALAQAEKRLPKPWPRSWTAQAVSEKDAFVLTINGGRPITSAQVFPLAPEQIENDAPQAVQATAHGARITLKKSDQLLQPIAVLKGLLVLGDEAYQMEAKVKQ